MKILNKFIWSKTEPKNKNDVWFDGSVFRLFKEEEWQAFTLPVDAADKVAEVIKNASEVYQEKLEAGYGIVIEDNVISVIAPDWNALANEEGYIKNRTHFFEWYAKPEDENFNDLLLSLKDKTPISVTDSGYTRVVKYLANECYSMYEQSFEYFDKRWELNANDILGGFTTIPDIFAGVAGPKISISHDYDDDDNELTYVTIQWNTIDNTTDVNKVIDHICRDYYVIPYHNYNIHQLNNKYIPNTIARKSDLENVETIPLINITYNELKTLRNSKKLVTGMQYRIIDYKTTTVQKNTYSADNQFDIIVIADSNDTLNEVARACIHDGDTYFTEAGANLAAWKVWYCLDNDIERFAWADGSEDYTINLPLSDSIRNLLQQSFGNTYIPDVITFKYWNHNFNDPNSDEWVGIDYYAATNLNLPGGDTLLIAYPHGTKLYSNIAFSETLSTAYNYDIEGNYFFINGQVITDLGPIDTLPTVLIEEKGKGVIYRLIDEWGNDCPYDFKNILFLISVSENDAFDKSGSRKIASYTFNFNDGEHWDTSIFGNNGHFTDDEGVISGVYNNVINKKLYSDIGIQLQYLNEIIFYAYYNYDSGAFYGYSNNNFDVDCGNIILSSGSNNNAFKARCTSSILKEFCSNNTFGINCYANILENECKNNTFGNNCSNNELGRTSSYNTFGDDCNFNSIGYHSGYNVFGKRCNRNKFRDQTGPAWYVYQNKIDDGVSNMDFYYDDIEPNYNSLQYHHVFTGVCGNFIELYDDREYETCFALDYNGDIKEFCIAELVK